MYATLRGKFVVWACEVDALDLTGTERVLDLGCGRGAVPDPLIVMRARDAVGD